MDSLIPFFRDDTWQRVEKEGLAPLQLTLTRTCSELLCTDTFDQGFIEEERMMRESLCPDEWNSAGLDHLDRVTIALPDKEGNAVEQPRLPFGHPLQPQNEWTTYQPIGTLPRSNDNGSDDEDEHKKTTTTNISQAKGNTKAATKGKSKATTTAPKNKRKATTPVKTISATKRKKTTSNIEEDAG